MQGSRPVGVAPGSHAALYEYRVCLEVVERDAVAQGQLVACFEVNPRSAARL